MNTVFLLLEKREENNLLAFLRECVETDLEDKFLVSYERCSIWEDTKYISDKTSRRIFEEMNEPIQWELELSEQFDTSKKTLEFITPLMKKVHCYAMDGVSDHFWTLKQIEEKKIIYGFAFFDSYGHKYRSGPYAEFGIISNFDKDKDYSEVESGGFLEMLKRYNCIRIPDEMINDWWGDLTEIDTYYHHYNNPQKALARWGVTLIPPESLEQFIAVVKTKTDPNFEAEWPSELKNLIELFQKAIKESKYIIHFGV